MIVMMRTPRSAVAKVTYGGHSSKPQRRGVGNPNVASGLRWNRGDVEERDAWRYYRIGIKRYNNSHISYSSSLVSSVIEDVLTEPSNVEVVFV